MKKTNKKGFTIVELVIVIAVIAILAAVLIPTFSGVIKKAHISADTQLVRNMNTALATDQAYTNQKPEDMTKVITVLHEAGYVVGNLNPTTEGYYYIWDSEKNQIVFINDQLTAHFPADADMNNKAKYWATAATAEEAMKLGDAGYSIYLEKDVEEAINLTQWVSFDAGIMEASFVSITGSGAATIKTYGQIADLTVNNTAGSVDNYGSIGDLNIAGIANACFNNYGRIGDVKTVTSGKLVNKAVIMNVSEGVAATNVDNTSGIIVASEVEEIPANIGDNDFVIEVRTATELQNLAYAVNDGADFSKITIKLMNDIDLSGRTWIPFGEAYNPTHSDAKEHDKKYTFSGTIDGNGHKITGLTNDGYVGGNAFYIQGGGATSEGVPFGLIAYASGNVTIKNLTITADISGTTKGKGVAAFIGTYEDRCCTTKNPDEKPATTIKFINCVANGKIEGEEKVAGFIGTSYISNSAPDEFFAKTTITFEGCTNNAEIIGNATGNCRIGGFVGTMQTLKTSNQRLQDDTADKSPDTFTDCVNNGYVHGTKENQDGEFIGVTGNETEGIIVFTRCSAKSMQFVGNYGLKKDALLATSGTYTYEH